MANSIGNRATTRSNSIRGTNGNDIIAGRNGEEKLYGLSGNDWIRAGNGQDRLDGGAGNDTLQGGNGIDILDGGGGNDTLTGGGGTDFFALRTGSGTTTITDFNRQQDQLILPANVSYGPDSNQIRLVRQGQDTQVIFDGDTLAVLQGVVFSEQEYRSPRETLLNLVARPIFAVNGNSASQTEEFNQVTNAVAFLGFDSDNPLPLVENSSEILLDQDENATLGVFAEFVNGLNLKGGNGNDTLTGNNSVNYLVGAGGNDLITGGDSYDILLGDAGDDRINGRAGNDNISGGAGNDKLTGLNGKDIIFAGAGNDRVDGGADNDNISGGTGNNRLRGGAGADTFELTDGTGVDTIVDFQNGQDRLDLSGFRSRRDLKFADFSIVQQGGDTRIALGNNVAAVLKNVRAEQITIADFIPPFADFT